MALMNEGKYWGGYFACGTCKTQRGNPQVFIDFDISHICPEGVEEQDSTPLASIERRTVYWALSDGAYQYTQERLESCGFNGDFGNMAFAKFVPQDQGGEGGAWLWCKHEEYNGKTRERWDLSRGKIERKMPENDEISKLNAKYRQSQRASGNTAPTPTPPAAEPAPLTPNEAAVAAQAPVAAGPP